MVKEIVKDKKVPCGFCGKEFNVPTDVKKGLIDENHICKDCYQGFAADPANCFGKQDQTTGKPLALHPDCKKCGCQYLKACAAWPKNEVVFTPPDENQSEKGETNQMTTQTKTTKSKASAKKTATSKTAAPAAGKGKGKATTPKEPKGEMVEYTPNCKFRKGTSIEIACGIITAKKHITLKEAVDQLKKAGVSTDNPEARILRAVKYLKDDGAMTREVKGDDVVFTFTKK